MDNLALVVPGVRGGALQPGQMEGYIVDQQGAVVQGAQVRITNSQTGVVRVTKTDSNGHWTVFKMPAGSYRIAASANGFNTSELTAQYAAGVTGRYDFKLGVGTASETVEVTAVSPMTDTSNSQGTHTFNPGSNSNGPGFSGGSDRKDRDSKKQEAFNQNNASANVFDLQKRVAGVLPVRIDVPRAGNSYRFARALVLDEETKVTFSYKTAEKK